MPVDQRLELRQLLPALLEGRVITPEVAQQLSALPASNTLHPLESIAALGPSLETLTEWLAQHAGQPYLRNGPLQIDVAAGGGGRGRGDRDASSPGAAGGPWQRGHSAASRPCATLVR